MVNSRGNEGIVHPGPAETVGPLRQSQAAFRDITQPLESKLDRVLGMLSRHDELFWRNDVQQTAAAPGLAVGAKLFDNVPLKQDVHARTFIIDNPSGYTLLLDKLSRLVPPGTYGYVVRCYPAQNTLTLSVAAGTSAVSQNVTVVATEEVIPNVAGGGPAAGGAGPAVTLAGVTAPAVIADVVPNPTTYIFGGQVYFQGVNGKLRELQSIAQLGASGIGSDTIAPFALGLFNGASVDTARTPTIWKPQSAVAIGAEATIWTPAAGKKFRLMGWVFTVSAGGTLTLRDNTAGTIIELVLLQTGVPFAYLPPGNGQLSAAANNVLTATLSVAGNLTGFVFGTEE